MEASVWLLHPNPQDATLEFSQSRKEEVVVALRLAGNIWVGRKKV